MPYPGLKHVFQKCIGRKKGCDGCSDNRATDDCVYSWASCCTVCLAVEGELLDHCPGVPLTMEAREDCSSGRVIDMHQWFERKLVEKQFH